MTDATIETERLILRGHDPADLADYARLWRAPPEPSPPTTPVLDEEGAWARLLRFVGHRALFGFAPFVVVERASGRVVGEVGFAHLHRAMGDDFDGDPEAMWILVDDRRGRGYGGEAAAAATAAFDARFPGRRSVCMIDLPNTASLRLAEGLGFTPWRRGERHGRAVVLLERGGEPAGTSGRRGG